MQALMDDDDQEHIFLVIVFTNVAAMYHASMILLILHKPTSISLRCEYTTENVYQRHFSSLWHARRVCGIAVRSGLGCWDPYMLAAFFLAAKCMTQKDQQEELITCLERVRTTGRRLEGLLMRLQEEWRLLSVHEAA
jgi:hypothetical protein